MTFSPPMVSLGANTVSLTTVAGTDTPYPKARYSCQVVTDPTTFQMQAVIDFGDNILGGAVTIQLTPLSFVPDGESFGSAPSDLHFYINTLDYSSDALRWYPSTPGTGGIFLASLGWSWHLRYLDYPLLVVVLTARYLRVTGYLYTGN